MEQNYLDQIKKEFPGIVPFEDADDENWENEGYNFLKYNEYKKAENKFKKLILSQPNHHGGFEGLSQVYLKIGKYQEAIWFMEEAVKRARKFLEDDSLDIEVIDEMEDKLKTMREKGKT